MLVQLAGYLSCPVVNPCCPYLGGQLITIWVVLPVNTADSGQRAEPKKKGRVHFVSPDDNGTGEKSAAII